MANILKKEPQTEMEYWEAIDGIGGIIWNTNHDIGHGRYENSSEIEQYLTDAQETIERLVNELADKFGVIPPRDCPKSKPGEKVPPASEGKTYYWDWYYAKKAEAKKQYYESIICSACPYSEGLESMTGFNVPCELWKGVLYRLTFPYLCAMLGDYGQEKLHQIIQQRGGEQALKVFKEKLETLKKDFGKKK
ncbi:MAG: hypothetical protein WC668_04500 [Patescibacteria group bacterium]|jgi:hypothetical protein